MNNIKKLIFKTETGILTPPVEGSIEITSETDITCYKIVTLTVETNIPVKVNMVGTFQTGGSYYIDTGFRSADIVDEVISAPTEYKFGINASSGGTLLYNSSINFTTNDFATDSLIDAYTLNRAHEADQC